LRQICTSKWFSPTGEIQRLSRTISVQTFRINTVIKCHIVLQETRISLAIIRGDGWIININGSEELYQAVHEQMERVIWIEN
jgi:hypothetical protein